MLANRIFLSLGNIDRCSISSKHSNAASNTSIQQYNCDYCGKVFSQSNSLSRHIRLHTGEKPFICSTCHKSFNQKAHLKTHLRIHSGEKPFVCQFCLKAYSYKISLKIHLSCCPRRH